MDQAVATPTQAGHNGLRNPGVPLAVDWFKSVGVNASAVERRSATLTARRSVKKEYQAAWLVKAMTCIDLTTLAGDGRRGGCGGCAPRHAIRSEKTFSRSILPTWA
jgi:deoxyribose-phosphate aldolase